MRWARTVKAKIGFLLPSTVDTFQMRNSKALKTNLITLAKC